MALATATSQTETKLPPEDLKRAFCEAMAFAVDQAESLRLTPQALTESANEESACGRISVDPDGFTDGMRLHLLGPARALMAKWRQARTRFDVSIEPKRRSINALQEAPKNIEDARKRAEQDKQEVKDKLEADQRYVRIRNELRMADGRYERCKAEHGNRDAHMGSYKPLYWLALLSIGVAEWLINYDVFFLFAGVVAIAAGATIVMGVLLAFAAHGHGLLLKQWSYRFGAHRATIDRFGDWRLMALSTFSLLIVIGAATGSRYAAVMHQFSGLTDINILGPDAQISVNPIRDVLLSLLWNVMAWAVGVFIAYMAHDKDPDFMDATQQYNKARRWYERHRRPVDAKQEQIDARLAKEIEKLETSAQARFAEVAIERGLLEQVNVREEKFLSELVAIVRDNAQTYRSNLATLASSPGSAITIERTGPTPVRLSVAEFRRERVNVTSDLIRGLV